MGTLLINYGLGGITMSWLGFVVLRLGLDGSVRVRVVFG